MQYFKSIKTNSTDCNFPIFRFKNVYLDVQACAILNVVIIVFGLSIFSCTRNSSESKETGQFQQQAKTPALVKTANCELKVFEQFIRSTGKIRPSLEHKILAPIDGQIKVCLAKDGFHVRQGQSLISYYTDELNFRLKRAKTNFFKSKLDFESNLLGYNSSRKMPDSVMQLLKASSGLTQAELDLEEIQFELGKANIKSPFSGRVRSVKVQKDWKVKSGDELFTIFSNNDLYTEVSILETDISRIKISTTADIMPISTPGKIYRAKVFEINPHVDENGMVLVKLKLMETEGLLPGMNANTIIHVEDRTALIVPREAVVTRSGRAVVFTVEK